MSSDNAASSRTPHVSVLLMEVLEGLLPCDGAIFLDGTFGAGGHSKALLDAANCKVIGIDRDPNALVFAEALRLKYHDRFNFIAGHFSAMSELLHAQGIQQIDGILLDIGVSSMQIDTPSRGFSFQHDGPLDMRMAQTGETAADFVNQTSEDELASILFRYGGEHKSRKIAKAIVERRETEPFTTTRQLAELIKQTVRSYNDTIHPATRSFQAIRMWVNNELGELEVALNVAKDLLKPKGRLAIITFHSGEDQIVKRFLQEASGKQQGQSRYLPPVDVQGKMPSFRLVHRKAIAPSEEEIKRNPRARSAKLRVAERI